MKTLAFAAVSFVAALRAAPAGATPLSDALARHSDRDVETLRAQRTEIAARCTLGAVYAQRGDVSRAALYLTGCDDAALPADVSAGVARIHRDLKRRLRESDLAMIEVISHPAGMTGEIDALPGDTFTTPATLYLKPGVQYKVKASKDGVTLNNVVRAQKRSRGAVVLESGTHTIHKPQHGKIDFTENGGGGGDAHVGPPPNVKHKNMLPTKYQKGMKSVADNPNAPEVIDDPLAIGEPHRASRASWLGLRLGGGMFDDGAAAARAGVAVAGTVRYALTARTFLSGRLDWSRRGGNEGTFAGVDVLAAGGGAGVTVLDTQTLGIALLAQVRGELRLAGNRTMTTAMTSEPVSRTGAAFATGVEISLPRTPFTAGLRGELGLTALVPGARDRAVLFELGVDWR